MFLILSFQPLISALTLQLKTHRKFFELVLLLLFPWRLVSMTEVSRTQVFICLSLLPPDICVRHHVLQSVLLYFCKYIPIWCYFTWKFWVKPSIHKWYHLLHAWQPQTVGKKNHSTSSRSHFVVTELISQKRNQKVSIELLLDSVLLHTT